MPIFVKTSYKQKQLETTTKACINQIIFPVRIPANTTARPACNFANLMSTNRKQIKAH